MPVNVALQGKAYPEVSFTVYADHVARFAAAVGDDGSRVPPTFVTVPEIAAGLHAAVVDTDLGMDLSRVVHGEQEYEWRRPLRVGETLTVSPVIESIRAKGGTELITLRTEMRDGQGETVVVARCTLIVRGNA